jgi:hypothetical protein
MSGYDDHVGKDDPTRAQFFRNLKKVFVPKGKAAAKQKRGKASSKTSASRRADG